MRKAAVTLVLALAVFAGAVGARADDHHYPPRTPDLQVSASAVKAGRYVFTVACCFEPGATVGFDLRQKSRGLWLANTRAGSRGLVRSNVRIPLRVRPGLWDLRAFGRGEDGKFLLLRATLRVR